VNSVSYDTSTGELTVNVTGDSTIDDYDVTFDNHIGTSTAPMQLSAGRPPWHRYGSLYSPAWTYGTGTGVDVQYRSGMTHHVEPEYVYFTGEGPWKAWFKVLAQSWTRGDGKTCELVFDPGGTCMMGMFGNLQDESSTAQYYQGEVLTYFPSNISRHYGRTSHNESIDVPKPAGLIKLKFIDDADNGDHVQGYSVTSSNLNDESVLLFDVTLAAFAAASTTLYPGGIPTNGDQLKLYASRVA